MFSDGCIGKVSGYSVLCFYSTMRLFVPQEQLHRYFGGVRFQWVGKKSIRLISACSVCSFLLYICVLQGEMLISGIHRDWLTNFYLSVAIVCLVVMDFLMYYIYFRCLSIEEKKEEVSLRLAAEEMQYQALTDKIQEDRRMQHNMRHHFRTLVTFLESGRYTEMQEYLQKYLKDWEEISGRTICRNPMLNTILSYYVSVAEKQGISLETDIRVKEHYPFAITDLTVLLGNAMENAVEACAEEDCNQGWYWKTPGNPLEAGGLNSYDDVLVKYNSNNGNLNDIFENWLKVSGPEDVHSFCNKLWEDTFDSGCITMV